MATYNKKKFYWLQLKEDFFEDDAIQWLEEQKPNGRDYAYFYLKLCLKSLKSNGILIRKVGNILIPYDNERLAELTRMDFDTVTVAMELLKQIGLIKILENGEIYINQLENLIGSKSIGAFKKQQQRLLSGSSENTKGGQKVDKCPPNIDIDIDINKDIDKEINKEKKKKEKNPTLEEIQDYITEKQLSVNAKQFYDYFTEGNWIDSKGNKVRNWKQKLLTWNKYQTPNTPIKQETDEERIARKIREMEEYQRNET